jgi:hypothetical protein
MARYEFEGVPNPQAETCSFTPSKNAVFIAARPINYSGEPKGLSVTAVNGQGLETGIDNCSCRRWLPGSDDLTGMGQTGEPVQIQAFIAKLAIETL